MARVARVNRSEQKKKVDWISPLERREQSTGALASYKEHTSHPPDDLTRRLLWGGGGGEMQKDCLHMTFFSQTSNWSTALHERGANSEDVSVVLLAPNGMKSLG